MTISDRRLIRVWTRDVAAVIDRVDGWESVTAQPEGSAWIAADPDVPALFERSADTIATDLAALWRTHGREVMLPLAQPVQRLADRLPFSPDDDPDELSADVYAMQ